MRNCESVKERKKKAMKGITKREEEKEMAEC